MCNLAIRVSVAFVATATTLPLSTRAADRETPPRLAVVISVDQLRADYLERFRPWFGEEGFERFLSHGAVFTECRYGYAGTKTAPGHATILSGAPPAVHGIIANDWLDPTTLRERASVEDADSPLVGMQPRGMRSPGGVLEARAGRSPRDFLAGTVGDQLKLRFGSRSRVFSASMKDRSAILLGGKLGDSVWWEENGRFVSSTYYGTQTPDWVETFNAQKEAGIYLGREWDRLEKVEVYNQVQGPDDAAGEGDAWGLGRMFPRTIDGGTKVVGREFYEAFNHSPFANEWLGEFAQLAVREERLGRHAGPDLLCLSFSQPDTIGHYAGPDSHEIMDSILRLDRVFAQLFAFLDAEVGTGKYVAVLTADHGVAPLPERVLEIGHGHIPAGRVNGPELNAAVSMALTAAFGAIGPDQLWCVRDGEGYRFHREVLAAKKVSPADAALVVRKTLLSLDLIAFAFTRDEVLSPGSAGDSPILVAVRNSYHVDRSQDVVFVYKPYFILRSGGGSSHGTPWDYDTHVPLAWFGPGVPVGRRVERVGVVDVAPTLAGLLGLPPPPQAQGRRLF